MYDSPSIGHASLEYCPSVLVCFALLLEVGCSGVVTYAQRAPQVSPVRREALKRLRSCPAVDSYRLGHSLACLRGLRSCVLVRPIKRDLGMPPSNARNRRTGFSNRYVKLSVNCQIIMTMHNHREDSTCSVMRCNKLLFKGIVLPALDTICESRETV